MAEGEFGYELQGKTPHPWQVGSYSFLKSINAHPRRFDEPLPHHLDTLKITPSTRKPPLLDPDRGLWVRAR
jgi:hypothetical protein